MESNRYVEWKKIETTPTISTAYYKREENTQIH